MEEICTPAFKFQPELETVWPDAFQLPVEIERPPAAAQRLVRALHCGIRVCNQGRIIILKGLRQALRSKLR